MPSPEAGALQGSPAGSSQSATRARSSDALLEFIAGHPEVLGTSSIDELFVRLDEGDLDGAFAPLRDLEVSSVPRADITQFVTLVEDYTGRTLRVTGTPAEFQALWADALATRRSAVAAGPTFTILTAPDTQTECPADVSITGRVTGRIGGTADFILVLDSSGSLSTNDPGDFRMIGANALADALTSADRLAVLDFDAPEICCTSAPTCTCPSSSSFFCPQPHTNHGTEVEACFLDPIANAADLDAVLTDTQVNRSFGGTSFQGAGYEILNLYRNCPDPADDWLCVNECAGIGFGSGPFHDNDRIGNLMPLGGGPRAGVPTKVVWFTDGDNTWGCDVTLGLRTEISTMDPDGVVVDLVKLGSAAGSMALNLLVNQTGGQIITVTSAPDLVAALLSTLAGIDIESLEAFNQTNGDTPIPVTVSPALPDDSVEFAVDIPGSELVFGLNEIRFEAVDSDMVMSSIVVSFNYVDTTDPVLTGCPVPDTITAECVAPPPPTVTAADSCDTTVEVDFDETTIPGTCPDRFEVSRTWSTVDDAGNTATCSQMVTVSDDLAPTLLDVPADITVPCDAIPPMPTLLAEDNCDPNPTVTSVETRIDGACPDTYTLVRTWTATDRCGLSSSATQTIQVIDDVPPVLIDVPADATVSCDAVPPMATPSATDNCDPNPVITRDEVRIDGPCPDTYTLLRTWTATDRCGLSSSATQTIQVVDNTPPVLADVPADETVECDAVPPPGAPTATDLCDPNPVITMVETRIDGSCADAYQLIRTWTAVDRCGNSVSATQTVTVVDTTPPTVGILLKPLAPLAASSAASPGSPAVPGSPAAPPSACSAPAVRAFQVVCEGPADNCDLAPTLDTRLIVTNYSVPRPGICEPHVTEIEVECDQVVEIRLLPALCPKKPAGPAEPSSVTSGIVVAVGNSVVLQATARDQCGNTTVVEYDPTIEPSPLCEVMLPDRTCCPSISSPPEPVCEFPVCGSTPLQGEPTQRYRGDRTSSRRTPDGVR